MSNDNGYYLMHRGWLDHHVLSPRGQEYDRRSAWVWLIENAAWAARTVTINGKLVNLDRGQLCFSIRFLAKAWHWDEKRVRRFLEAAAGCQMIALDTAAGQSLISVVKYNTFQMSPADTAAPKAADAPQTRRGGAAKTNTLNKRKEESKGEILSPLSSVPLAAASGCDPSDRGAHDAALSEIETWGKIGPEGKDVTAFEEREGEFGVRQEAPDQDDLLNACGATITKLPDLVGQAKDLWNAVALQHGLALVQKITPARRAACAARLRECGGIEGWKAALAILVSNPFYLGVGSRENANGAWKADFDFVCKPAKFQRLMESASIRNADKPIPSRSGMSTADQVDVMRGLLAKRAAARGGV
jgi:hypothetical protein